jgi:hypothetical protein
LNPLSLSLSLSLSFSFSLALALACSFESAHDTDAQTEAEVKAALDAAQRGAAGVALADTRAAIDTCFAADSVEGILARLGAFVDGSLFVHVCVCVCVCVCV